jgi:Na+/melibiose symporter-like transporter
MFSSPNADQGLFYYITNDLGIEPSFIGILTAVIGAGGIISAIFYNLTLSNFSFKPMFFIFGLVSAILGLSPILLLMKVTVSWGISDKAFLISTQFISSLFDNVLLLLILVFASRVCPKNIEGTLFAVIMGIINFAYLISNYLGALTLHGLGITENSFQNLWIAIVISKIFFIIPLIFIKFIPDNLGAPNDDDNEYSLENFNPQEAGFVEMGKD